MRFFGKEYRPRLRYILLMLNLFILAFGGVISVRIFERTLVAQTEEILLYEGHVIAASYQSAFDRHTTNGFDLNQYGNDNEMTGLPPERFSDPTTNLSLGNKSIRPPLSLPQTTSESADPLEFTLGIRMNDLLSNMNTRTAIQITEDRGIILASTDYQPDLSVSHQHNVASALQGIRTSSLHRLVPEQALSRTDRTLQKLILTKNLMIVTAIPIVLENRVLGAVVLSRSVTNIFRMMGEHYVLFGFSVLVLIFLSGVVSIVAARIVTGPLRTVVDQARRTKQGEKGAIRRLTISATHEVDELSREISDMAIELERVADQLQSQTQSVQEIAEMGFHGSMTPLGNILDSAEELQDNLEGLTTEQLKHGSDITDETNRLVDRMKKLGKLAQARFSGTDEHPCSSLSEVLTAIGDRYSERGLKVDIGSSAATAEVAMADAHLEDLVGNLVENAYQHGGDQVNVRINADKGENLKMVEISVHDDGVGIPVENTERIFKLKFTTGQSRNNSGWGLAMTKAHLERRGGHIELVHSSPGSTTFLAVIPLC